MDYSHQSVVRLSAGRQTLGDHAFKFYLQHTAESTHTSKHGTTWFQAETDAQDATVNCQSQGCILTIHKPVGCILITVHLCIYLVVQLQPMHGSTL